MAEFSIDPKGVEALEEEALEKAFDERKGDIARLMGIVAPSCRRMTLVCRWVGSWMRFLCSSSNYILPAEILHISQFLKQYQFQFHEYFPNVVVMHV